MTTAPMKPLKVRPLPRFAPAHIEAEKNVKPSMMTNMEKKLRFWLSETLVCSKSLCAMEGSGWYQ